MGGQLKMDNTATSGWGSLTASEQMYGVSAIASGVTNIASSIFNYKAAGEMGASSVKAAKRQRDRVIREMTEQFVQQEAAEKVSLWESGLQYRGTAEAIEENNIKMRETKLEETRQYYSDMIKDLRKAERASKTQSIMSGIGSAIGTAATLAVLL